MKFTDMNFDCLETVLEYLELIDLLNVADSTKRLNKAAELVFARKHGNKTMRIRNIQISRDRTFRITDEEIEINDSKTALQLLRCFGPVICKISFIETSGGNLPEIDENVLIYINKYCADYLEELKINQFRSGKDLLNYFDRPFQTLKKFGGWDLVSTENSCLNKLFPNMRCLNISHVLNYSFYNIHSKHFPYLEQLCISEIPYRESCLCKEMVINLLQLNPQLLDLTIWPDSENSILNTDLIQSAVDSLQNVEKLILRLKPITFLGDSNNIIQMKSVKIFQIDFNIQNFDVSSYLLPFLFENLEMFGINFPPTQFVNGSFIDQFYKFIDRHSSITGLTIGKIDRFDVVDWSRLATSLPLLLLIDITKCCIISADEAFEIMAKFQMIKRFRFKLTDDYNSFRKNLDKDWYGTYKKDEKIVELKRK